MKTPEQAIAEAEASPLFDDWGEPAPPLHGHWYVSLDGHDGNTGDSPEWPITVEELRRRLNPGGAPYEPEHDTIIHMAPGRYEELDIHVKSSERTHHFTIDVVGYDWRK